MLRPLSLALALAAFPAVARAQHHQMSPGMADATFPVGDVSLGHVQPIVRLGELETALGIRGSVGFVDAQLEDRYGTRTPVGVMAFIQIAPATMAME